MKSIVSRLGMLQAIILLEGGVGGLIVVGPDVDIMEIFRIEPIIEKILYFIGGPVVIWGGGIFAILGGILLFYMTARVIIITEEGVVSKFLFIERRLLWHEIKEWGLGQSAVLGFLSIPAKGIYFSTSKLPEEERKELMQNRTIRLLRPKTRDILFVMQYSAKKLDYINSLEVVKERNRQEREYLWNDV